MALGADTKYRTGIALADTAAGADLSKAADAGLAANEQLKAQVKFVVPAMIVATATSTTTDFGSLVVGDKVLLIPATAGNAQFLTVATAGTLPEAAVVGDMYLVLRALNTAKL
jgi:hypothetical protein